jgi:hypothetical protein
MDSEADEASDEGVLRSARTRVLAVAVGGARQAGRAGAVPGVVGSHTNSHGCCVQPQRKSVMHGESREPEICSLTNSRANFET